MEKIGFVQPYFREEPQNVKFCLAINGFDPLNDKSCPSNMCPVVLVPYNVSPGTCLKVTNYLFSMLIPVPKAPTNDVDVYLQPLIDELNDMWLDCALTYEAYKKEKFQIH